MNQSGKMWLFHVEKIAQLMEEIKHLFGKLRTDLELNLSVILAKLTVEDETRFHAARIPYSGSTGQGQRDGAAPYIAICAGELVLAIQAMGWTEFEVLVVNGQWRVRAGQKKDNLPPHVENSAAYERAAVEQAKLKADRDALWAERDEKAEKIAQLTEQLVVLGEQVAALSREKSQVEGENSRLWAEIKDLQVVSARLTEENLKVKAENEQLLVEKAYLLRRLAARAEGGASLMPDLKELIAELERRKAELSAVNADVESKEYVDSWNDYNYTLRYHADTLLTAARENALLREWLSTAVLRLGMIADALERGEPMPIATEKIRLYPPKELLEAPPSACESVERKE